MIIIFIHDIWIISYILFKVIYFELYFFISLFIGFSSSKLDLGSVLLSQGKEDIH